MLQILHNTKCQKSRTCFALLKKSKLEFEIINYLENPLTVNDLKVLLKKLNIKPIELVRQKEAIWIEHYKGKSMTDSDVIMALANNPILIERPILINGDKAIISRDLNNLNGFI